MRGRLFEGEHATRKVTITQVLPHGTVHVPVLIRPLPSPHLYSGGRIGTAKYRQSAYKEEKYLYYNHGFDANPVGTDTMLAGGV
jgi:hypothetical protein